MATRQRQGQGGDWGREQCRGLGMRLGKRVRDGGAFSFDWLSIYERKKLLPVADELSGDCVERLCSCSLESVESALRAWTS